MPRALEPLRFARAIERIRHAIRRVGGPAPGLRLIDGWFVADGTDAAQTAVAQYHHTGGLAPAEITMIAQLIALYGGQVALALEGVVIFVPSGLPDHLPRMAHAAGFVDLITEDQTYRALIWSPDPDSVESR